jgi:hypothetical protein
MSGESDILNDIDMGPTLLGDGDNDAGLGFEASFDNFWQIANQTEMDFGAATWDNIFSALDSRPF